jgi:hypothetical protein
VMIFAAVHVYWFVLPLVLAISLLLINTQI